jgi:hypothetical protein
VKKFYLLFIAVLIMMSSCATIFKGTSSNLKVSANQPKAMVSIKNQNGIVVYDGEAPALVKLSKNSEYTVAISLDGYKTQTIGITRSVTGWFWGNLCLGGVVGMVIDYATGGMWDLNPSHIDVKLAVVMTNSISGPGMAFYTRDDDGQLRYIVIPLIKAKA